MVAMTVQGLAMDPFSNMPFLILKDAAQLHRLPIWIGLFEASAIASELESIKLARPMTHDLLASVVTAMQGQLQHVEIYDFHDNTYFARLVIQQADKTMSVDCRPSDAIALALRLKTEIRVEATVLEKSKSIDLKQANLIDKDKMGEDKWKELLENLPPENFGKYKM